MEDYWSEGVQRRRDKLVLDLVATFTRLTSGTSSTLKGSCNLSLLKSHFELSSPRTARRIEDLKVQLAVISDLEKNLASNGSIDAKSREEIGKKEEYIVELRRLEGKLY